MNPNYRFILICALICCIPAVVFFVFRDKNDSPAIDAKPRSTVWPLKQETEKYDIVLTPQRIPLTMGSQRLSLKILNKTNHKPISAIASIQILMPMGKDTMVVPTKLTKLASSDQYQVQTEFKMAGHWELLAQPQKTDVPIQMNFLVEP